MILHLTSVGLCLTVVSTQPHWDSLTVRAQHGGQTGRTGRAGRAAPVRPADSLVVNTAASLARGSEGLHTDRWREGWRGVVQVVSQGLQGVLAVSPDPLHHRASSLTGTDSLERLDTAGHGLVVFSLLYDDPTFLLKLRLTVLTQQPQ